MPNLQIMPPRVPITDPRTGTISREWYRFLFDQFIQVMNTADVVSVGLRILPSSDGEPGEEGQMGMPGPAGQIGPPGLFIPGQDGIDGEDAMPIPGPRGSQGERGPIGFGIDGEPGEDAFCIPPSGFSGTITTADLVGKTITVVNGVITSFA